MLPPLSQGRKCHSKQEPKTIMEFTDRKLSPITHDGCFCRTQYQDQRIMSIATNHTILS